MITQKFNKQFTERELNNYLTSISSIKGGQSKRVDKAWRKIGYINASAYKGYGELSARQDIYNRDVYSCKEKAIVILAQHTDNIVASGNVLYIRTLDGVQISFHLGSTFHRSEALDNICQQYHGDVEWDGVQNSYEYTDINAYNEARAEYQRKRQEDAEKKARNIAMIHEEIQKMFVHHSTRKAYGLPVKKQEWLEACAKAMSIKPYTTTVSGVVMTYREVTGCYTYPIEVAISRILPKGWDKYNFND
jgi:hypothetical protein